MNFDFIGRKHIWFIFSAIIIAVGIASLVIQGINLGIDFTGGTIFDLKLSNSADVEGLRQSVTKAGVESTIIQPLGEDEILIRSRSLSKDEQKAVVETVDSDFGIKEVLYIQNVGPGWGEHITNAARLALILSLGILLLYISIRFEFKMAVAAIIALIHDIFITIGVYSVLGREITPNTIAAILTILGYSLYDTIVVFHRIKENSTRIKGETYSDMVNKSINQVLVRSINTSLITLLPVTALLLLGGATLKDFSLALLIGMLSGVYSSIFVASPIVAMWKEREPRYRSMRAKLERA